MKASEIILESEIMKDSTRGEALEKLQDLVFEHYKSDIDFYNGSAIDAMLVLFDQIIADDHGAEMGLIASINNVLYT